MPSVSLSNTRFKSFIIDDFRITFLYTAQKFKQQQKNSTHLNEMEFIAKGEKKS